MLEVLTAKREAISQVLDVYASVGTKAVPTKTREAIRRVSIGTSGSKLNTIDMARVVIRNAGKSLPPAKIKENIKSTFGIDAAKTLYDMLWKRARAQDSGFYKDEQGNIGLVEMLPKMETVATISSSTPQ